MMKVYVFSGRTPGVALIIAGIHGTEVSGIEVANWVRVKLTRRAETGKRATFTTLVVPEVFPESTNKSREVEWPAGKGQKPFNIPPNRQYPPPGKPLQFLEDRGGPVSPDGTRITSDASSPARSVKGGVPLLEGTRELLRLIEMSRPKRIASIHAHRLVENPKKGVDAPAIFVDPRYEYREGTSAGGCQVDLIDPNGEESVGNATLQVPSHV